MTRQPFPSIACPCGCPSAFPRTRTIAEVKPQRAAFIVRIRAAVLGRTVVPA
jgi:hypothetical protein